MKDINVHIGEVKIGQGEQMLHALLGSCVGIAILYTEKNTFGLAHCLLPKNPEENFSIGGRFVDQAISSLFELMKITKEDYREIKAVVAGGGNMTMPDQKDLDKLVGHQNVICAMEILNQYRVKIIHEDTGGLNGRRISINCFDGSYNIKIIPRPLAA